MMFMSFFRAARKKNVFFFICAVVRQKQSRSISTSENFLGECNAKITFAMWNVKHVQSNAYYMHKTFCHRQQREGQIRYFSFPLVVAALVVVVVAQLFWRAFVRRTTKAKGKNNVWLCSAECVCVSAVCELRTFRTKKREKEERFERARKKSKLKRQTARMVHYCIVK